MTLRLIQAIGSRHKGGAQKFTLRLSAAMEAEDVQHGVLVKRNGWVEEQLRQTSIKTYSLPFGGALDVLTPIRYSQIVKSARPNLILTHLERATKRTPKGPWLHVARLGGYYELNDYRHCDYLIGNTPGCLDYFRQGGWDDSRIFYIPNFVPEAETAVTPARREDFDTPADVPLIVWLGRIEHEKGPDIVLRALQKLDKAYLWLGGAGSYETEIRALTAELGLADRVRFLGWQNDVHPFLKAADVFVCASRFEVFGNIILEAWSHGLPVVSVRSPGPEHLIDDDVTGLLVPSDDPDAMANAFRSILADQGFAKRIGDAGRKQVEKVYSEVAIVSQYRSLFDDLLSRQARADTRKLA